MMKILFEVVTRLDKPSIQPGFLLPTFAVFALRRLCGKLSPNLRQQSLDLRGMPVFM
jgi:hypothetical protein